MDWILMAVVILGVVVVLTYAWFRLGGKHRRGPKVVERTEYMELGEDPLDPHGDGTLRPGDPLYEVIFNSPNGPVAVMAERESDTSPVWKVTSTELTPDEKDDIAAAFEAAMDENGHVVLDTIIDDEEE